jgi:hypothetical protein
MAACHGAHLRKGHFRCQAVSPFTSRSNWTIENVQLPTADSHCRSAADPFRIVKVQEGQNVKMNSVGGNNYKSTISFSPVVTVRLPLSSELEHSTKQGMMVGPANTSTPRLVFGRGKRKDGTARHHTTRTSAHEVAKHATSPIRPRTRLSARSCPEGAGIEEPLRKIWRHDRRCCRRRA